MLHGGFELGSVKIDLESKGLFYKNLTFSDINVVRLLIEFRYKYDNYLYSEMNNTYDVAGEVQGINTELLSTYASLDQIINQCAFNESQLQIIKLYEHGYSYKEIAEKLGLKSNENIRKRLNTICKEIVKQNLWNWRMTIYHHTLNLKLKDCSKCKNKFPAIDEFFGQDARNKDGCKSYCRKCENSVHTEKRR